MNRLSAKTEYACIALLELAAAYGSDEPVRIRSIAERHGIPQRFLVQILLQLKGAGLVSSTRGATGGYRLQRPPEEITLAEVVGVIEGPPEEFASNASADTPAVRILLDNWREVAEAQKSMLDDITFEDLVEQLHEQSENMYYI